MSGKRGVTHANACTGTHAHTHPQPRTHTRANTVMHACRHTPTYAHARATQCVEQDSQRNKHIRAEKIHARHATNTKCTSITTLAWGRSGSYIRRWIRTCKLMSGHETLRGCGEPMGDLVVVGQNERAKGHVFCGKKLMEQSLGVTT